MHPAIIIAPAIAVVFGPGIWVKQVLRRYNQEDIASSETAAEIARTLLDKQNLQAVKVEYTDVGDHYDPDTRSVRLSREKFDSKSLTAITTAAHEVGHALQHATDYTPFVWRLQLVKVARVVGEVGTALLVSVPILAMTTRTPTPPILIGIAAMGILGTGLAVQLVTLPTEVDASFNKAIRMLEDGAIDANLVSDARKILFACSLTYVASSLLSVLTVWPWLPRVSRLAADGCTSASTTRMADNGFKSKPQINPSLNDTRPPAAIKQRVGEAFIKRFGKPFIRGWLEFSRAV